MKYKLNLSNITTTSKSDCCQFYTKLFELYNYAHIQHLVQKNRSYATHKAMEELYEYADDFLDSFIEMNFGLRGVEDIQVTPIPVVDPVTYVQQFYDYVQESRFLFPESFLQNELDTLSGFLMSIKYKLNYVTAAPL